jgi:hypothetical protein
MEDTMPEYVGDMSIRYIRRAEDEPLQINNSLLAQCEIDALRSEVQSLRYDLMLARGEVARLKDMVDNPSGLMKFLGFPFRYVDESDDDCRRLTYQVFYCGNWRDVNTCSLSFNRDEAIDEIIKMIKREAGK